jgi:hypothetical protein
MSGRNQYMNRFQNSNMQREEMERRWRIFEEMRNMQEIMTRAGQAASVAPGSILGEDLLGDYVEDYVEDYFEG